MAVVMATSMSVIDTGDCPVAVSCAATGAPGFIVAELASQKRQQRHVIGAGNTLGVAGPQEADHPEPQSLELTSHTPRPARP